MPGPRLHDAATAVTTVTASTTCTVTHTVTSGTNLALVVELNARDTTSADRAQPTVVWDAAGVNEALTAARFTNSDTASKAAGIFYLLNPTAGTSKTITITWPGTITDGNCGAYTLANVHQSAAIGDTDSTTAGSGTSASLTLTTTAANSLLIDTLIVDTTPTKGTNRQQRFSAAVQGNFAGSEWSVPASGANFAMGWTFADSGHVLVAAEFKAAAQPGGNIVFDAASNNANDTGSTITLAHTVGLGSNRFLYACAVAVDATEADRTVSGISSDVDGAFTLLAAFDVPNRRITCGYKIAPTTGAHVITVTLGGANTVLRAGGVSFSGVHQSDPLDGATVYTANGTATDATDDITTNTDSAVVLGLLTHGNNINHFSGPGQTVLQSIWGTNVGRSFAVEPKATAGVVTMNWTSASSLFQNLSVSLRTAAAAGGQGVRRRQVIS